MRTTTRVVGLLAATTLTLTTLTACSNDPDTGSSDTSSSANAQVSDQHNDAYVEFATAMIPHHAQAIAMAQIAEDRAESQEVKDLAADIEAAQGPEIDLLSPAAGRPAGTSPSPARDIARTAPGRSTRCATAIVDAASLSSAIDA